jgi:hypothetical protein
MRKYRVPLEVSLGVLLWAGLLAGAAMAQKQDKDTAPPPDATAPAPATPQNRSGLPPAPPEVVPPGSAARPFTGNDATQPPPRTTVVPKDQPAGLPK